MLKNIRKEYNLCNGNCNCCPIIQHPNSRVLTVLLNKFLEKFGNEVYEMVEHFCCNLTVCFDCRIDDFTHTEICNVPNIIKRKEWECK